MPSQVIVYGNDATLLQTRGLVLEVSGIQALTAGNLACVEQISRADDVDLLILCHTLSGEECGRAVSAARSYRPALKSLLLTASRFEDSSGAHDVALSIFEGPKAFLEIVDKLLYAVPLRQEAESAIR